MNLVFNLESTPQISNQTQKLQLTFTTPIPEMGHLGGGSENDLTINAKRQVPLWLAFAIVYSEYADFNIPTPFSSKVRNALRAEPRSVRLSNLVGAGGLWYGFGKVIMEILADEQGKEMSDMLTTAFKGRLVEVIDQAQHFAALGPAGGGGPTGDSAQAFREGLDATERELFILAQESARRMKKWYEESEKGKR
ncbi:DNA replication protein [Marasmius crinis-equi]|uniref:DNA replication complex GINS protein PSF3 n=1 Tax=Marasmius crinis-equi TaxID=585013 RepID=A0ABR3G2C3_9AGAR